MCPRVCKGFLHTLFTRARLLIGYSESTAVGGVVRAVSDCNRHACARGPAPVRPCSPRAVFLRNELRGEGSRSRWIGQAPRARQRTSCRVLGAMVHLGTSLLLPSDDPSTLCMIYIGRTNQSLCPAQVRTLQEPHSRVGARSQGVEGDRDGAQMPPQAASPQTADNMRASGAS